MDVWLKIKLPIWFAALICALPLKVCAVDYYVPGFAGSATPAVAPQILANTDTLSITAGTFQTTNSTSYTVDLSQNSTISVLPNATISYAGTGASAVAIRSVRANNATINLRIQGRIAAGTGSYAILMNNTNAANTDSITIGLTGIIDGGISIANATLGSKTLALLGAPVINGNIDFGGTGVVILGQGGSIPGTSLSPGTVFSTGGSLNINNLDVSYGSTCYVNNPSVINLIQIYDGNSTLYVNQPITRVSTGVVFSQGTIVLAADLNMNSTFTNQPVVGQPVANIKVIKNVTVATSSYNNTSTHTAVITDNINQGRMTLTNTTPVALTNFVASYGGGYLSSGTYTLLAANAAIVPNPVFTQPANTQFLTFSNLHKAGSNITITVARKPYQTIATTAIAQMNGYTLEMIGANSQNSSVINLLNAVERSTTTEGLNNALHQLSPSLSGPMRSIAVQNQSMLQVATRLQNLRTKAYAAGDESKYDSVWLRPFGDIARQETMDEMPGYNAKSAGLAFGCDESISPKFTVGVAGTYGVSLINDKANANSSTRIKSYQAMVYSSYDFGKNNYFDLISGFSLNNYHGYRHMDINALELIADTNYNNKNFSIKGLLGKNFLTSRGLYITPEFSAQYTKATAFAFEEKDAPAANLIVYKPGYAIVQLGLGARVSGPKKIRKLLVVPELHTTFLYNAVNRTPNTSYSFLAGGTQMMSRLTMNKVALRSGFAVTWLCSSRLELKLNFDVELQKRYQSYATYLNFRYLL